MRWPRGSQRALALLAAALLAAAAWSLARPPSPVLRSIPDDPSLDLRIDLNAAPAAELEAVPGIGPALAARILEHRERLGPFATLDALSAVPGIGPATLASLRPYLEVHDPPAPRLIPGN